MDLSSRQSQITLAILTGNTSLAKLRQLPQFHAVTARTIQRDVSALVDKRVVTRHGEGRTVTYEVTPRAGLQVVCPDDVLDGILRDESRPAVRYDFNRLGLLADNPLFSTNELAVLESCHETFAAKLKSAPADIIRRERERITVELSWKSSQFEGNTYSLLETETLLKEGAAASGKSEFETTMVLNHKKALDFSAQHADLFAGPLRVQTVIELHKILVEGLGISFGLRERHVAITGTVYMPLGNKFQIEEELKKFCQVVNAKDDIFEKALLALTFVSYLQPFNDGNKRTGRILANALLYAHNSWPLSLRAIDANTYKRALLAFYEFGILGNATRALIKQARFSSEHYAI